MINFKLTNIDATNKNSEIEIIEINKNNIDQFLHLIELSINFFNDEIIWDGMFNIDESIRRVNLNHTLYLGIYNSIPFAHVWFKPYEDGYLLYNLFVRNKIEKKMYKGSEFTYTILSNYYESSTIYANVDEWNIKSINMFKKLGFKITN